MNCLECGREVEKLGPTHLKKCSGITMQEYYVRHSEAVTARTIARAKWREANRDKQRGAEQSYRQRFPERVRASYKKQWDKKPAEAKKAKGRRRIFNSHGITGDDYESMLERQNGVCAICKGPQVGRRLHLSVDHCHETLVVRGLLCDNCNRGIGFMQDNPDILRAAAAYLDPYKD